MSADDRAVALWTAIGKPAWTLSKIADFLRAEDTELEKTVEAMTWLKREDREFLKAQFREKRRSDGT